MNGPVPSPSRLDAVFSSLKSRILAGTWPVGAQLPTEVALAGEFRCHRSTVSKALARLAHEKIVERRRRTGTRVLSRDPGAGAAAPAPALQLDACAFIYPSERHEGVWRTVQGFREAAADRKRRTVLLTTGADLRQDMEIVGRLAEFDVKGAALFPVLLGPEHRMEFTRMVLGCPFPVVLVQTILPDVGRPCVAVDALHAGYTAARHLAGLGLREIGFLGNFGWSLVVREKHAGYRQAMFEAGLDGACARLGHLELEMRPDFDDPLAECRRLAGEYLRRHPGVEGIVCSTDYIALGVLEAARELGRRVPGDLKVVGMDDFALGATCPVPLTTYRVPYEEMGARAFDLLSRLLTGDASVPRETAVRGGLVVRQSA